MKCEEKFYEIYRKDPQAVAFCPYRICPVGAHVDHNFGKITGFAIDKGIHFAYSAKQNGVVEICSLQFDKRAQWHVAGTPKTKQDDWADYLRGATLFLSQKHPLDKGVSGVIEGTLPIGGLSSSAAVVLVFLKALCEVNGIRLQPSELISLSVRVENEYVGVSCGKLDQSCEIYAKEGHLLHLDTLNDEYELIPASPKMKPYGIAIFFSGLERSLAGTKFNMRVDECRSAAYAMKAFAGLEYGKFNETVLRQVPYSIFEEFRDKLPLNWRKRAIHWYSEQDRVERSVRAWKDGDVEEYGRIIFESGRSSIDNYETGSPEMKELYEIMTRTEGIYGGRFSGAGFKGCCMAVIDPSFRESILEKVGKAYLKAFPGLEGKYQATICRSAEGLQI